MQLDNYYSICAKGMSWKLFFAKQVLVTEREQQGSTITCRCNVMSGSIAAHSVIALFRSTMAVETHVGSVLTVCSPWRESAVAGNWLPSTDAKPCCRGQYTGWPPVQIRQSSSDF